MTTTVHPEMSDLFFNHTHDNYNGIGNMATPDLMCISAEDAILKDAREFVSCYPTVCRLFKVTAEQLAADFMKRL